MENKKIITKPYIVNNSQHLFRVFSRYALMLTAITIVALFLIEKDDLVFRGLYLFIPLSCALIYILLDKNETFDFCEKNLIKKPNLNKLHLILLFILIYIITLLFLVTDDTRNIYYFISQTVLGMIIFTQIVLINVKKWDKYVIILEIILSSLVLIWGLNLKYPLYYGSDLLIHFDLINTIINQHYITEQMGYYKYFPLYHILGAICTNIFNLSIPHSIFFLGGITYQISLLFSYILFSRIYCDRIALLGILILSFSRDFVYYGGYFITRSLTFSIFLIYLYLIYISSNKTHKNNERYKVIQILILLSIILSHQVSMFYILFILISCSVVEFIYGNNTIGTTKFKKDTILLFAVSFVSYWIYLATKFFVFILYAFRQSQEVILASTEKTGMITSENILSTNINNIDSGVISFFIIIGAYYGLSQKYKNKDVYIISLCGLLLLVLYIRSPLYMIPAFTKIFVAQRIALLLSPIMAFIAALGINSILNKRIKNKKEYNRNYFIIFALFSLLLFTSISNSLTAQDNPILAQEKEIPTPYFSQSDLNLRHFIEKMNVNNIYADQILVKSFPSTHNLDSMEIKNNDLIIIPNSYIVIRYKELRERCLRIITGERSIWDEEVKYYNEKDLNIKKIEEGGVIYSSNCTRIYKF